MADNFPSAQVFATDLSPIQPQWVPPNLHFEVDDCETEWNFSQKFDFIHMRNLGGSIADWPKLIKMVYENTAPGSYFEVVDWETYSQTDDGSLPRDSNFQKWQDDVNAAAVKFGREMKTASNLKGWVTDAGFVDVQEEVNKVSSTSSSVPECFADASGAGLTMAERQEIERNWALHASADGRFARSVLSCPLH